MLVYFKMNKSVFRSLQALLSRENRKSAFLNCLVQRSGAKRLDLKTLDGVGPFTARDILKAVYSNREFEVKIPLRLNDLNDSDLDKLLVKAGDQLDLVLRRLYLMNEEVRSEKGRDALYLGYPILQHRHPIDKDLNFTAPLLLWKVSLKPSKQYDHWILERKQDDPIRLNHALRIWLLENRLPIPAEPSEELLEEGHLDYEGIKDYISALSAVFGIQEDWTKSLKNIDTLGPDPLPDPIDEQSTPPGFRLYTSAVLGIFQAYREAIIQDLNHYIDQGLERDLSKEQSPLFDRFEFSPVEMDASQHLTHTKVGQGGHAVIHGPPGTGKSTVLTGIITTALANQRRVLMVCEKKAALDVIASRLDQLGLHHVYALIQDATADRKAVVTKARAIHDNLPSLPVQDKAWSSNLADLWRTLGQAWDHYGIELKKSLWDDHSVESLLTLLAKESSSESSRSGERPPLSEEQATALLKALENEKQFAELLEVCNNHSAMLRKISAFVRQSQWPEEVFKDGQQFVNHYSAEIEQNSRRIHHYQRLLGVAEDLVPLQKEHEYHQLKNGLWRFARWITSPSYRQYQSLSQKLILYAASAEYKAGPLGLDLIHYAADIRRALNKIHQDENNLKEISCSESDMALLVNCLNDFRKLNLGWIPDDLSTYSAGEGTKSTNAQIQHLRSIALVGLVKGHLQYLESVFGAAKLDEAISVLENASIECIQRIIHFHKKSSQAAIQLADRKFGFRRLYNLRGQSGQTRNSLHHIASTDKDLWMTIFPVTLCTPETASILFAGESELFDMVLFDEASQMRVEESMAAMLKGRTVVVAGDKHQMPPSNWFEATSAYDLLNDDDPESEEGSLNTDSFLEYCIDHAAFSDNYLTFHYRSEHPALIQFSNAGFYGNLKPLPLRASGVPFEIHEVNGTYIYQTNPEEAFALVDALLKVEPDLDGEFPSVGVVTLNLKQRDFIVGEIIRRRRESSEDDRKMLALEKAGLFVRNLENIQGDERDLIFLSTTFGRDLEGQFKRNFGKLATRQGYRLLNVLITRARSRYVVFTSIPSEELSAYEYLLTIRKENWGYGLFYAWLTYIRQSVATRNWELSPVLELLHKNRTGETITDEQSAVPMDRLMVLQAILDGSLPGLGNGCLLDAGLGDAGSSFAMLKTGQKIGQFEVDWLSSADSRNSEQARAIYLMWGASRLLYPSLYFVIQRNHYFRLKGITIQNYTPKATKAE